MLFPVFCETAFGYFDIELFCVIFGVDTKNKNMIVDILEFISYLYKEVLPLETVASVISYSNQQPYLWLGGCFFDAYAL